MSNESKIVLSNKQNGTTTEIIDNNSKKICTFDGQ